MAEKKKNRIGLWIVVGLVMLGLLGFGAGGFSGHVQTLGTVGTKEIRVSDYQNMLNNQINNLSQQFGTPLTFQQAQQFGLDQAVLSELVRNRSLDSEADTLGISAGDETVLNRLQQIPQFQGSGGTFNRESYRYALQQLGQAEADFEDTLREDVARALLQGAVIGGIPSANAYAQAVVQYVGEQRSVTWASLDADVLTTVVPAPTDPELQAYYNANPDDFTLPEARNISYAWLTPDMIQDQMTVNDIAIEQLYSDRIAEFILPERRLVERLVFLDQAQADAAKARLDAGEVTFEDLVVERGLSLADIDLGDVSQEDLGNAGEAVYGASAGAVVGPFSAGLGPALFRMNAVLAAQETTLAQATPALREELAADAAREVINQSTDQTIDLLAGGASVEDLAERTDMQLGTISWTADMTDGIAAYDAFRQAAATVQEGAFAEVEDLADGGIFAVRLDGVTPPTIQPLDEVRDDVITAWQAQATQDAIRAIADEKAADIAPLTGFDTLGLEPNVDENLDRRSFVAGTPPDFMDAVFEMESGDVRVIDGEDGIIIARLDVIAPPDLSADSTVAQLEQIAASATQSIAQDVFETYAIRLQEQTDVNINQATLNAVNAYFR